MSPSRRRAGWRGARRGIVRNSRAGYAPPLRTAITHAIFAQRITRAARWGHRALPPLRPAMPHGKFAGPLHTRNSPTMQSVPRNTTITHAHCTSKIRMRGTCGHYAGGGHGAGDGGRRGRDFGGEIPDSGGGKNGKSDLDSGLIVWGERIYRIRHTILRNFNIRGRHVVIVFEVGTRNSASSQIC